MAPAAQHTSIILDQEIDAVEICPSCPDYVVVGTYSLVKDQTQPIIHTEEAHDCDEDERKAEDESAHISSFRIGSLIVLAFDQIMLTSQGEQPQLQQARYDLPCAILDIHFCPSDSTLLCVATSIGELRLFRVTGLPLRGMSRGDSVQIIPVGIARITDDEDDAPPIITQFTWIESTRLQKAEPGVQGETSFWLAACDTRGRAKLIQIYLPIFDFMKDHGFATSEDLVLRCRTDVIHKHLHNLEAWTIAVMDIESTPGTVQQMMLSGGDDSCFIMSSYTLRSEYNMNKVIDSLDIDVPPVRLHLDKHTHTAGVVSILPLQVTFPSEILPPALGSDHMTPVLTGSYDQYLRLFLFDSTTMSLKLVSDFELAGGIWRIALLDVYSYPTSDGSSTYPGEISCHCVFLVSAMHAGCYIVRLTCLATAAEQHTCWKWQIETNFQQPHESMVYACTAKRKQSSQSGVEEHGRHWKIMSTSFYDKKICVWEWMDSLRPVQGLHELGDTKVTKVH